MDRGVLCAMNAPSAALAGNPQQFIATTIKADNRANLRPAFFALFFLVIASSLGNCVRSNPEKRARTTLQRCFPARDFGERGLRLGAETQRFNRRSVSSQ